MGPIRSGTGIPAPTDEDSWHVRRRSQERPARLGVRPGCADVENHVLATPEALFHMALVSKTITGAVLLHLWESGRFNLDDDVNQYLPFAVRNPRFPDRPVTFRMLLTHTSSINDYPPGDGRDQIDTLFGPQDSTLWNVFIWDGVAEHVSGVLGL